MAVAETASSVRKGRRTGVLSAVLFCSRYPFPTPFFTRFVSSFAFNGASPSLFQMPLCLLFKQTSTSRRVASRPKRTVSFQR